QIVFRHNLRDLSEVANLGYYRKTDCWLLPEAAVTGSVGDSCRSVSKDLRKIGSKDVLGNSN
ncbi:MAG TPA: hypothetical protein PK941_10945, partial [Paludibacter sp.]|nr:hypothetical protein [Paludibacter sp.]